MEAAMTEPEDPNLSEEELDDWSGPDLGAMLRAALEGPDDIEGTARSRLDQTLKGRSLTSTVTDIAGAGLATVWHLLTPPPDAADRSTDDRDET
jgi:hypothetical protein